MEREIETTAKAMTSAEEEFLVRSSFIVLRGLAAVALGYCIVVEKGLSGCGEYRSSGSFDCAG
jgi:hypothetical protein